jgi:hypothetical protein
MTLNKPRELRARTFCGGEKGRLLSCARMNIIFKVSLSLSWRNQRPPEFWRERSRSAKRLFSFLELQIYPKRDARRRVYVKRASAESGCFKGESIKLGKHCCVLITIALLCARHFAV